MLLLTAGSLLLRRLHRRAQPSTDRRLEAPDPGADVAEVPRPLTAPLGILVRRPDRGWVKPQGDLRVMVRWEADLPEETRRVAFASMGGPRRARPREVRNGRFGRLRGTQGQK